MASLKKEEIEELYRRYGAQIERRCKRLLGDKSAAEDTMHDVFCRVIKKGPGFRRECEWATWLYRVTMNLCLNRLRDASRRRELRTEKLVGGWAESFDPRHTLEAREFLAHLLDNEDEVTQQIVIAHYIDGIKQSQIGNVLKIRRGTVNRKLAKFKKRSTKRKLDQ